MANKNMALWGSVFKTDPSAVKEITGKSYKGNSPKPYWLIEQATKTFGPCGIGWGVQVVKESFQQVGPDDFLHTAIVRVWYVYDGNRGEIEQAGGTKAAYKSSASKIIVDEDAAKKSITDGMVKCLSMIGFAGDIFSGRWDDSKYVEGLHDHFADEKAKENGLITKQQEANILALAHEVGANIPGMAKHYQCRKFTDLPDEMYDQIIAALEKKRKAQ